MKKQAERKSEIEKWKNRERKNEEKKKREKKKDGEKREFLAFNYSNSL